MATLSPPFGNVDELVPDERARSQQGKQSLTLPVIVMLQMVYDQILETLTTRPPELAGLLLGPKCHEWVVTHFLYDETAAGTAVSVSLDHVRLNKALPTYLAAGLDVKGYVHSHPAGCDRPSYGDLEAVRQVFAKEKHQGLQRFLVPIVTDNQMYPYVALREDLIDQKCYVARLAQLVLI